jgi:hypothetical protein
MIDMSNQSVIPFSSNCRRALRANRPDGRGTETLASNPGLGETITYDNISGFPVGEILSENRSGIRWQCVSTRFGLLVCDTMKIIPFILTTTLILWFSARGWDTFGPGILSTYCMILALLVSLLLPWSLHKPVTSLQRRGSWLTISFCVLIYILVVATQWPLRLTFALSHSSLEHLAKSLREGKPFQGPQRAGFFVIQNASFDVYPDTVCLWTGGELGNYTGFVDTPGAIQYPFCQFWLSKKWRLLTQD